MRSRFIQRAVRANPCLCLASPRRLTCITQLLMTSSFVGGGGGFLCQVKCHGRAWPMISLASMSLATLPFLAGLIPLVCVWGGICYGSVSPALLVLLYLTTTPATLLSRWSIVRQVCLSSTRLFWGVRGAMWMNLISFVSPTNHTNGQRFSL